MSGCEIIEGLNSPTRPPAPAPRPPAAPRPPRADRPDRPPRAAPAPANPLPRITYPESLPVSSRREDIAQALREHQVLIVCGETGSGKTTQLPKIVLELGRGRANGGGLIGHTQPRRIAASSVAKRIAFELDSPLGEVVGYRVRFQDKFQPGASVKLMTDGILLAETQSDPLLKAYDTIIIDEAHERSLNIDFLLGYLRQILPRRPDLKVIVTSATIDADRFAKHFESAKGPAPVIMVSGRLFPVEQRWRPFEESREYGLNEAIADAVDELWRGGPGDVLVFLPGEREIREAAETLRKHHPPGVEILPLFARLSQAEQDRVFETGAAPRIVLTTNVAETSLTVPGIRYVIDSGLARVKRYSYRNKVEQLQIEPISQAACNQRAGRCGRVANGTCIRLFDEKDFSGRPRFTDPEILRSSLAGVILRMKSLRFGAVEDFPFLEEPPRKAIADGYALLGELNAVDDFNDLTPIGTELARLPLDPRVGRMILEARERHCLTEVLVIASALSGQDVRDRPMEQAQAADEKHKKFDDERSEFMGYLKLWKWLDLSRGGQSEGVDLATAPMAPRAPRGASAHARHGGAQAGTPAPAPTHKLSHRRYEQLLRENFVSVRRVREWRDIHSQLLMVVADHGWQLNTAPADYDQVHLAMLAGLLGNLGLKSDDDEWYLGARGIRFWRHPGAHLSKKPGRWIVTAELVETTRLYGRGIAAIDPQWIPGIAGHLLKTPAARAALGEEGRRGDRAGARHAVRHRRVPEPARELRPGRPGGGARDLPARGHGAGRVGHAPAVPGPQPEDDPAGAGPGAQVASPGRAGGRRADLRVLRPAGTRRRGERRHVREVVSRRIPQAAEAADAHARRADAPRGRGHHHGLVPEDHPPGRRRLAPWSTCTSPAMPRTASPSPCPSTR